MTMSITLLLAILCAGTAVSQVQVPCYGEGCANVTVYLGPRWGSKVIMVPRRTITVSPRANSTNGGFKLDGDAKITGDRFEEYDERYRRPQHKPVPQNGEMQVDFMDDEPLWRRPFPTTESPYQRNMRLPWWSRTTTGRPPEQPWWSRTTRRPWEQPWWSRTTTRRPPELPWWRPRPTTIRGPSEFRNTPTNYPGHDIRVIFDGNWRGTVDLSWRGYTEEDVKQALMTLPESDRRQVTTLILDGNKIRYLPSMMFPIEFEYGLLELSLNDNPIDPPYLSSYTRFELSRLGHLKTLNMSRCGLRSIDMPYLPSLEVLDLSYNYITYLPQTLGRMTNLLQLFLRGNKLSYISQSPLSSLESLWVLDLGDNGLKEFWGEPLENLDNLVTVRFDNNFLTSMPLLDATRTKIVFLANNSLQCSCSLLHWFQQPNLQIQDVHDESCQDEYNAILLKHMMIWHAEDYQGLCGRDQWWGIRAWNALTLWYRRNPDIMRIIYKVVGVTSVMVALVMILRRRRRLMAKVKSQGIPYNALDDHQISIVSGPQSHA